MIKASYLQKQAIKYRDLARAEASLEMRRQLFALAARCDELAATMARWPGPKDLASPLAPKTPRPVAMAEPRALDTALPFPERRRARLVHGAAD